MKKLSDTEKNLFLSIGFPGIKDSVSEESKGLLLYAFKKGKAGEKELLEAFGEEYLKMLEVLQKKKILFDKNNYVFEYFFTVHNKEQKTKVITGQIIGFKAEIKKGKNIMTASIRTHDGKIKESGLEVSPSLRISDFNLNDFVLIHNNTICCKITEDEFKKIIHDYF